jgi:hypothetical protein
VKRLNRSRSCLLYWLPKIKDLGIPIPETDWVEIPHTLGWKLIDGKGLEEFRPYLEKIKEKARRIGYPIFIRTDQASGKHLFDQACLVLREEGPEELLPIALAKPLNRRLLFYPR